MYFYAQYWSDRAHTWIAGGDQEVSLDDAIEAVKLLKERHPNLSDDEVRVTAYLTPLSQNNEDLRLAR